jgi:hypothetical protein
MRVEENTGEITIIYVQIQSLVDAHSIYIGQVSGKQYDWMKAGDIVPVLSEDAPELLLKRRLKKSCCGSGQNQIFQIAS